MSDFDLTTLSLTELKKLERRLARAIAGHAVRAKASARAEIEAIAKAHGFKLADLVGEGAVRAGKVTGASKYVHPENPALTWSGRGRRPAWIADGLDAGKALEDFLIS